MFCAFGRNKIYIYRLLSNYYIKIYAFDMNNCLIEYLISFVCEVIKPNMSCYFQELNLENNQIEFISDRAFAGLNHLRKLCLSHNRLAMLSGGLLGGVSTIIHLDLRSNNLETITYDSVKPIIQNLRNETSHFYITGKLFNYSFLDN